MRWSQFTAETVGDFQNKVYMKEACMRCFYSETVSETGCTSCWWDTLCSRWSSVMLRLMEQLVMNLNLCCLSNASRFCRDYVRIIIYADNPGAECMKNIWLLLQTQAEHRSCGWKESDSRCLVWSCSSSSLTLKHFRWEQSAIGHTADWSMAPAAEENYRKPTQPGELTGPGPAQAET